MLKKSLTILVCVAVLLCLLACNKHNENTNSTTGSSEEINNTQENIGEEELETPQPPVFKTENIKRITFYGYYGAGKASEVPSESMEEIINWLKTFKTDKKVDIMPPGTNTHIVEIEYIDGTVIKNGLDAVQIDGTFYYIKKNTQPDCYYDIISKSTLPMGES